MDIKDFERIESNELNGIWFKLHGDCRVKVARYGNAKFQEALRVLNKAEISQVAADGEMSVETLNSFATKQREMATKHLLQDWEGINDGDSEYKCTEDHKKEMMAKDSFYRKIIEFSQEYERFETDNDEEDVKN